MLFWNCITWQHWFAPINHGLHVCIYIHLNLPIKTLICVYVLPIKLNFGAITDFPYNRLCSRRICTRLNLRVVAWSLAVLGNRSYLWQNLPVLQALTHLYRIWWIQYVTNWRTLRRRRPRKHEFIGLAL